MRVTLYDEDFHPSPQEMADEFWKSDSERQAEILYALSEIYYADKNSFERQMAMVSDEFNYDDMRTDVVYCLSAILNQIER